MSTGVAHAHHRPRGTIEQQAAAKLHAPVPADDGDDDDAVTQSFWWECYGKKIWQKFSARLLELC